jgi:hypothetical protein
VSYEFLFIYDLKKRKLLQCLKCEHFISVVLEDEVVRVKIWDNKKALAGSIVVQPDQGCKRLEYEIKVIIRHYSPNFIFA